jgi:hypothetical protein
MTVKNSKQRKAKRRRAALERLRKQLKKWESDKYFQTYTDRIRSEIKCLEQRLRID